MVPGQSQKGGTTPLRRLSQISSILSIVVQVHYAFKCKYQSSSSSRFFASTTPKGPL
ncbi:hypothetical protein HZ326_31711, partial [Fusarium oxysporum f. sp. albedinis]